MLDWFTTIPGILITCGVILLFVAVVLFILGNKKEKNTSNLAMNTGVMNQPLINDEVMTKDTPSMIIDETNEAKIEGVNPINPAVIDFTPTAEAVQAPVIEEAPVVQNTNTYDFSVPTIEPVVETNEVPTVEPTVTDTNQVEETVPAYDFSIPAAEPIVEEAPVDEVVSVPEFTVPTIEPVVETNEVPTVEPTVTDTNQVEETVPAYDFSIPAAEPVVEEAKSVEPEVTIYGGNDPLINTQVNTEVVNHEPYSGTSEATIVPPVATPVVEENANPIPTISIPEIQPVTENKEGL